MKEILHGVGQHISDYEHEINSQEKIIAEKDKEIAKLKKMLDFVISRVLGIGDCPYNCDCKSTGKYNYDNGDCTKCIFEWLEKQIEEKQ